MMKILLVMSTLFTVSFSQAETSFIEESKRCDNGNALQADVTITAGAKFSVTTVDGKTALVRSVEAENHSTTYSLSLLGTDKDTQQPSYMAFSQNGGHFIVVINAQNEVISIIENDRDFQKCGGGLVVIQLTTKSTES